MLQHFQRFALVALEILKRTLFTKCPRRRKITLLSFFVPFGNEFVMSLKYVQSVEGEGGDTVWVIVFTYAITIHEFKVGQTGKSWGNETCGFSSSFRHQFDLEIKSVCRQNWSFKSMKLSGGGISETRWKLLYRKVDWSCTYIVRVIYGERNFSLHRLAWVVFSSSFFFLGESERSVAVRV